MTAPDLPAAADAIDLADRVVGRAVRHLASLDGGADTHQVLAYDLAHGAAAVATAKSLVDYGGKGDVEARITCAYTADMLHELSTRLLGREQDWGVERDPLADAYEFIARFRAPEFLASLADQPGPSHLSDDMEMVADTFGSFAQNVIAPHAEHVHRTNADVPEEIVTGPGRARRVRARACRRSTAGSARAATRSTSRWSSPPRSSPGPASGSAAR